MVDSELRETGQLSGGLELTFWMQYFALNNTIMYVGYCECDPDTIIPSNLPRHECEECGEWIDLSPLAPLKSGGEKLSFLKHEVMILELEQIGVHYVPDPESHTDAAHGAGIGTKSFTFTKLL